MREMFPGKSARMVAMLILAFAVLMVGLFAAELVSRYRWAGEELDTIEPRYARLAGLQNSGGTILARNVEAATALVRLAHGSGTEVGRIGTDLQQRIRRIAEEVNVRVTGSQILPVRQEDGVEVITVTGKMDGEIGAISELMLRLRNEEPPVIVEKLLVQAARARRGEVSSDVSVQASMSVLRMAP